MTCKCKHHNSCSDGILKIPYGNDFSLGICRDNVAPGNSPDIDFSDIDNLKVYLTRLVGNTPVTHEVGEQGDLILNIAADEVQCATYGLLATGTYNGHSWRWKARSVFRIVDLNASSSVGGLETFGAETYWIDDVLEATITENDDSGETLTVVTHSQMRIDDNNDIIVIADNVALEDNNETLTIKNK